MALDHSQTYRTKSLKNLPHRLRLKSIFNLLDGCNLSSSVCYADFGCSNGYITDLVARRYSIGRACGFDCEKSHLDAASFEYPGLDFRITDLNDPIPDGAFDFVTCFETLEHVGDLDSALRKLLSSCRENGLLVITVPVETGLVGLAKFLVKTTVFRRLYGREIAELFDGRSVINYLLRLALNKDISAFRTSRDRWGTHFGFDYRAIDRFLKANAIKYTSFRSGTTRFYAIRKC